MKDCALFGSAPSYEHLLVFGCACYPNTTATAPHNLAPRSTLFLGYTFDHKGYRCLDLSTNRLIVFRHVVFYEDSFPLGASPNPTNLDFLCESGSTVSTVGTRLTIAGTVAPCQPAPEVPPGFEPLAAPLSALTVPPRFLPRVAPASTTAPCAVSASSTAPTAVPDGPAPRVPLHPLFGHLLREDWAWWCMSRLRRILTGWSHGRRMASVCYLIDSS
jgi:hypothetical protein